MRGVKATVVLIVAGRLKCLESISKFKLNKQLTLNRHGYYLKVLMLQATYIDVLRNFPVLLSFVKHLTKRQEGFLLLESIPS